MHISDGTSQVVVLVLVSKPGLVCEPWSLDVRKVRAARAIQAVRGHHGVNRVLVRKLRAEQKHRVWLIRDAREIALRPQQHGSLVARGAIESADDAAVEHGVVAPLAHHAPLVRKKRIVEGEDLGTTNSLPLTNGSNRKRLRPGKRRRVSAKARAVERDSRNASHVHRLDEHAAVVVVDDTTGILDGVAVHRVQLGLNACVAVDERHEECATLEVVPGRR